MGGGGEGGGGYDEWDDAFLAKVDEILRTRDAALTGNGEVEESAERAAKFEKDRTRGCLGDEDSAMEEGARGPVGAVSAGVGAG